MKNCHVCGFACDDAAELCALCGAELATFEAYAKQLEETIDETEEAAVSQPVLAVSVSNIVTAEIYKDVLKDNNIPFTCDERDESLHIVFGGGFTAVDIYVAEENLDIAQRLYDEVANAEPEFDEDDFEGFPDDAEE